MIARSHTIDEDSLDFLEVIAEDSNTVCDDNLRVRDLDVSGVAGWQRLYAGKKCDLGIGTTFLIVDDGATGEKLLPRGLTRQGGGFTFDWHLTTSTEGEAGNVAALQGTYDLPFCKIWSDLPKSQNITNVLFIRSLGNHTVMAQIDQKGTPIEVDIKILVI